jgi:hypothetical protein
VGCGRRDYADELHVVTSHYFAPIISDMFYRKLFRNFSGTFAMFAGDGHHPRAHTIAKAWDLGRARKPSADDANANCLSVGHSEVLPRSANKKIIQR